MDRIRKQSMARARAEGGNSVFDVRDLEDLQDIEEDCEGEVGEREVVLLAIRSITVVLVVLGSVLLTFKVFYSHNCHLYPSVSHPSLTLIQVWKRRRGSWKEAAAAVSIQIIWQVGAFVFFLFSFFKILCRCSPGTTCTSTSTGCAP